MAKHLFENIDGEWTLFLDRDGVINKKLEGTYVKRMDEFEFLPGVLDALSELAAIFGRIIIVTNQQGIGKEYMTHDELETVHHFMAETIMSYGGRIDEIYYCPFLAEDDPFCRKPNIGMALQAKEDFPDINFRKSFMVGDSPSDIEFGQNLEMKTVYIGPGIYPSADFNMASLKDFSVYLG